MVIYNIIWYLWDSYITSYRKGCALSQLGKVFVENRVHQCQIGLEFRRLIWKKKNLHDITLLFPRQYTFYVRSPDKSDTFFKNKKQYGNNSPSSPWNTATTDRRWADLCRRPSSTTTSKCNIAIPVAGLNATIFFSARKSDEQNAIET